jgi:tyrosyl-tRNA synthetase
VLALEATRLTHGGDAAEAAQGASRALFRGEGEAEGAPTTMIPAGRLTDGIALASLVVETGLARSRAEATRLIQQGGISVNGERIDSPNVRIDEGFLRNGVALLRAGRKRFHRVVVEGG